MEVMFTFWHTGSVHFMVEIQCVHFLNGGTFYFRYMAVFTHDSHTVLSHGILTMLTCGTQLMLTRGTQPGLTLGT